MHSLNASSVASLPQAIDVARQRRCGQATSTFSHQQTASAKKKKNGQNRNYSFLRKRKEERSKPELLFSAQAQRKRRTVKTGTTSFCASANKKETNDLDLKALQTFRRTYRPRKSSHVHRVRDGLGPLSAVILGSLSAVISGSLSAVTNFENRSTFDKVTAISRVLCFFFKNTVYLHCVFTLRLKKTRHFAYGCNFIQC